MMRSMENKKNIETLKDIIRRPYTWPGGYERAAVTTDGGLLCHRCLKEEYHNVLHSTMHQYNDGWEVAGQVIVEEFDAPIYCDHCSSQL